MVLVWKTPCTELGRKAISSDDMEDVREELITLLQGDWCNFGALGDIIVVESGDAQ